MNKKLVIGGLCAIVGLAFLLSQNKTKQVSKGEMNQIYQVQISNNESDSNYKDYLKEFERRVVARSESQNFKCEIINSGKGGSAYNTQKSNSYMNSIFYIGDCFSSFAPELQVDDKLQP
ncbi:hypothetical protein HZA97_00890 [Candidatus Woesearchaeota archaeon]|nr:hypothetical protein [Candidatus Woesearchaeota archaeon]